MLTLQAVKLSITRRDLKDFRALRNTSNDALSPETEQAHDYII